MARANRDKKIYRLAMIGVMSALVFALSALSIPIGTSSRIHFGNIMCLLAGLLFGPGVGGLSAGIGSMLYDFTNPLYVREFWITFINKFAMGFAAGALQHVLLKKLGEKLRLPLAAAGGALLYVALYLFKNMLEQRFVLGVPWDGVWPMLAVKGAASLTNGLLAVVGSVLLYTALKLPLQAAGVLPRPAE